MELLKKTTNVLQKNRRCSRVPKRLSPEYKTSMTATSSLSASFEGVYWPYCLWRFEGYVAIDGHWWNVTSSSLVPLSANFKSIPYTCLHGSVGIVFWHRTEQPASVVGCRDVHKDVAFRKAVQKKTHDVGKSGNKFPFIIVVTYRYR